MNYKKEYKRTKTKLEFIKAVCLVTFYVGLVVIWIIKQKGVKKGMEEIHIIGKSEITDAELKKQTNEILDVLKKKKQTYAVNKFVLVEAIKALEEVIV